MLSLVLVLFLQNYSHFKGERETLSQESFKKKKWEENIPGIGIADNSCLMF